ncbi:hypothetical protein [Legionella antarctica]|uniref:hypothetical protein n=1 Tax=Legionella antarctica TaxID=2708020 RepID=UPI0015666C8B|nr:hypothetical protein [Legionella antarctica]
MNYRLDIKKGLLVRSNDGTIASNQQSAISNQQSAISNQQSAIAFSLFSMSSIIFYCVYFLCSGFLPILLLSFYSAMRISPFIRLLLKSIAAACCLSPFNKSFVLYKERL